jgi:hypothetical protein
VINLKINSRLWAIVIGAIVVAANGCNLSPQPEPPFSDTAGPTAGSLGGEANEVPGAAGATGPDFAADGGAQPAVPPGTSADTGPADGGLSGDASGNP